MANKLSGKTPEELYYLNKIVDRLLAHYDNQMQANEGMYSTAFQKEEYAYAKAKRDLYTSLKENVIEAMESVAIATIADTDQLNTFQSKMEKIEKNEETVAEC